MPWLQKIYQRYGGDYLRIIGLTEVTRSATDESVRSFIHENHITYPNFKADGSAREYFDAVGTPFMIVVRDGIVVWEHRLPTEQFPEKLVEMLIRRVD